MLRFLQSFHLNQTSFWLGFLAGVLAWWLLGKVRPFVNQLRHFTRGRIQAIRQKLLQTVEVRHANDTLRQAQTNHLAASLFSLDEILIPPRLIVPPQPFDPNRPTLFTDITESVLPYLPDWPELSAVYGTPTLTLAEALQGGANLAILGQPGSGKSVALAHLAIQLARNDPQCGDLARKIPLLTHAADLSLPARNSQNLLATLQEALSYRASTLTQPRLKELVQSAFESGQALLLLDGLDELPQEGVQHIVHFLDELIQQYPSAQVVVTASPEYFDGLLSLDFIPLPIAAWDQEQRSTFIAQWSRVWLRLISGPQPAELVTVDPDMLNNWVLSDTNALTPLELTLKVWGAYAGDLPGPSARDTLEAYLRRKSPHPANVQRALVFSKERLALQHLAGEIIFSQQPIVTRKDAESWLSEYEPPVPTDKASNGALLTSRVLPELINNRLLVQRPGDRLTFIHPVIAGYLARQALVHQILAQPGCIDELLAQPEWIGKSLALHYLAAEDPAAPWLGPILEESWRDPLQLKLFSAARWLRDAPETAGWCSTLLRQLANLFQTENVSLGTRARAMSALLTSNNPGVVSLLRQCLKSVDPSMRLLACLGCGVLRDVKSVLEITTLLADPDLSIRRAACLSLVAIGEPNALEAVASALLHGDEDLRRAAAEALANHPEEGYPTLVEGSTLDDLLVRRAVVYGLIRIRQPWVIQTLEKMREDSQWVVQTAATQALEILGQPLLPRRLPPLSEIPWLIAYAAGLGIGIAPGRPVDDLLLRVLNEGNEGQRLAALHVLTYTPKENFVLSLYQIFYSNEGELREAVLNVLWHWAASGVDLPSKAQFGFPILQSQE